MTQLPSGHSVRGRQRHKDTGIPEGFLYGVSKLNLGAFDDASEELGAQCRTLDDDTICLAPLNTACGTLDEASASWSPGESISSGSEDNKGNVEDGGHQTSGSHRGAADTTEPRSINLKSGTFEFGQLCGRGGSADVYQIYKGGRRYAVKVANLKKCSAQGKEALSRELEILKSLGASQDGADRPCVKMHAHCVMDGFSYLFMECADTDFQKYWEYHVGKSCLEASAPRTCPASAARDAPVVGIKIPDRAPPCSDGGPGSQSHPSSPTCDAQRGMSLERIKHCWPQMVRACEYVHSKGVIHFDVKPANFLVFCDGARALGEAALDMEAGNVRIKISDFGIAASFATRHHAKMENKVDLYAGTHVSRDHLEAGTLSYLAPESIFQPEAMEAESMKLRPSVDIWALGIILYQCFYNETPFSKIPSSRVAFAINDPRMEIQYPSLRKRFEELVAESRSTTTSSTPTSSGADQQNGCTALAEDAAQLASLLRRCLQRDAAARPTATEILTELEAEGVARAYSSLLVAGGMEGSDPDAEVTSPGVVFIDRDDHPGYNFAPILPSPGQTCRGISVDACSPVADVAFPNEDQCEEEEVLAEAESSGKKRAEALEEGEGVPPESAISAATTGCSVLCSCLASSVALWIVTVLVVAGIGCAVGVPLAMLKGQDGWDGSGGDGGLVDDGGGGDDGAPGGGGGGRIHVFRPQEDAPMGLKANPDWHGGGGPPGGDDGPMPPFFRGHGGGAHRGEGRPGVPWRRGPDEEDLDDEAPHINVVKAGRKNKKPPQPKIFLLAAPAKRKRKPKNRKRRPGWWKWGQRVPEAPHLFTQEARPERIPLLQADAPEEVAPPQHVDLPEEVPVLQRPEFSPISPESEEVATLEILEPEADTTARRQSRTQNSSDVEDSDSSSRSAVSSVLHPRAEVAQLLPDTEEIIPAPEEEPAAPPESLEEEEERVPMFIGPHTVPAAASAAAPAEGAEDDERAPTAFEERAQPVVETAQPAEQELISFPEPQAAAAPPAPLEEEEEHVPVFAGPHTVPAAASAAAPAEAAEDDERVPTAFERAQPVVETAQPAEQELIPFPKPQAAAAPPEALEEEEERVPMFIGPHTVPAAASAAAPAEAAEDDERVPTAFERAQPVVETTQPAEEELIPFPEPQAAAAPPAPLEEEEERVPVFARPHTVPAAASAAAPAEAAEDDERVPTAFERAQPVVETAQPAEQERIPFPEPQAPAAPPEAPEEEEERVPVFAGPHTVPAAASTAAPAESAEDDERVPTAFERAQPVVENAQPAEEELIPFPKPHAPAALPEALEEEEERVPVFARPHTVPAAASAAAPAEAAEDDERVPTAFERAQPVVETAQPAEQERIPFPEPQAPAAPPEAPEEEEERVPVFAGPHTVPAAASTAAPAESAEDDERVPTAFERAQPVVENAQPAEEELIPFPKPHAPAALPEALDEEEEERVPMFNRPDASAAAPPQPADNQEEAPTDFERAQPVEEVAEPDNEEVIPCPRPTAPAVPPEPQEQAQEEQEGERETLKETPPVQQLLVSLSQGDQAVVVTEGADGAQNTTAENVEDEETKTFLELLTSKYWDAEPTDRQVVVLSKEEAKKVYPKPPALPKAMAKEKGKGPSALPTLPPEPKSVLFVALRKLHRWLRREDQDHHTMPGDEEFLAGDERNFLEKVDVKVLAKKAAAFLKRVQKAREGSSADRVQLLRPANWGVVTRTLPMIPLSCGGVPAWVLPVWHVFLRQPQVVARLRKYCSAPAAERQGNGDADALFDACKTFDALFTRTPVSNTRSGTLRERCAALRTANEDKFLGYDEGGTVSLDASADHASRAMNDLSRRLLGKHGDGGVPLSSHEDDEFAEGEPEDEDDAGMSQLVSPIADANESQDDIAQRARTERFGSRTSINANSGLDVFSESSQPPAEESSSESMPSFQGWSVNIEHLDSVLAALHRNLDLHGGVPRRQWDATTHDTNVAFEGSHGNASGEHAFPGLLQITLDDRSAPTVNEMRGAPAEQDDRSALTVNKLPKALHFATRAAQSSPGLAVIEDIAEYAAELKTDAATYINSRDLEQQRVSYELEAVIYKFPVLWMEYAVVVRDSTNFEGGWVFSNESQQRRLQGTDYGAETIEERIRNLGGAPWKLLYKKQELHEFSDAWRPGGSPAVFFNRVAEVADATSKLYTAVENQGHEGAPPPPAGESSEADIAISEARLMLVDRKQNSEASLLNPGVKTSDSVDALLLRLESYERAGKSWFREWMASASRLGLQEHALAVDEDDRAFCVQLGSVRAGLNQISEMLEKQEARRMERKEMVNVVETRAQEFAAELAKLEVLEKKNMLEQVSYRVIRDGVAVTATDPDTTKVQGMLERFSEAWRDSQRGAPGASGSRDDPPTRSGAPGADEGDEEDEEKNDELKLFFTSVWQHNARLEDPNDSAIVKVLVTMHSFLDNEMAEVKARLRNQPPPLQLQIARSETDISFWRKLDLGALAAGVAAFAESLQERVNGCKDTDYDAASLTLPAGLSQSGSGFGLLFPGNWAAWESSPYGIPRGHFSLALPAPARTAPADQLVDTAHSDGSLPPPPRSPQVSVVLHPGSWLASMLQALLRMPFVYKTLRVACTTAGIRPEDPKRPGVRSFCALFEDLSQRGTLRAQHILADLVYQNQDDEQADAEEQDAPEEDHGREDTDSPSEGTRSSPSHVPDLVKEPRLKAIENFMGPWLGQPEEDASADGSSGAGGSPGTHSGATGPSAAASTSERAALPHRFDGNSGPEGLVRLRDAFFPLAAAHLLGVVNKDKDQDQETASARNFILEVPFGHDGFQAMHICSLADGLARKLVPKTEEAGAEGGVPPDETHAIGKRVLPIALQNANEEVSNTLLAVPSHMLPGRKVPGAHLLGFNDWASGTLLGGSIEIPPVLYFRTNRRTDRSGGKLGRTRTTEAQSIDKVCRSEVDCGGAEAQEYEYFIYDLHSIVFKRRSNVVQKQGIQNPALTVHEDYFTEARDSSGWWKKYMDAESEPNGGQLASRNGQEQHATTVPRVLTGTGFFEPRQESVEVDEETNGGRSVISPHMVFYTRRHAPGPVKGKGRGRQFINPSKGKGKGKGLKKGLRPEDMLEDVVMDEQEDRVAESSAFDSTADVASLASRYSIETEDRNPLLRASETEDRNHHNVTEANYGEGENAERAAAWSNANADHDRLRQSLSLIKGSEWTTWKDDMRKLERQAAEASAAAEAQHCDEDESRPGTYDACLGSAKLKRLLGYSGRWEAEEALSESSAPGSGRRSRNDGGRSRSSTSARAVTSSEVDEQYEKFARLALQQEVAAREWLAKYEHRKAALLKEQVQIDGACEEQKTVEKKRAVSPLVARSSAGSLLSPEERAPVAVTSSTQNQTDAVPDRGGHLRGSQSAAAPSVQAGVPDPASEPAVLDGELDAYWTSRGRERTGVRRRDLSHGFSEWKRGRGEDGRAERSSVASRELSELEEQKEGMTEVRRQMAANLEAGEQALRALSVLVSEEEWRDNNDRLKQFGELYARAEAFSNQLKEMREKQFQIEKLKRSGPEVLPDRITDSTLNSSMSTGSLRLRLWRGSVARARTGTGAKRPEGPTIQQANRIGGSASVEQRKIP